MRSVTLGLALVLSLVPRARASAATPYEAELAVAQDLARQAGALVMKMRTDIKAEKKDGGEMVTAADRAASELIVAELKRRFPDDLVITEESKQDWRRIRYAKRVWYVDPIDGTKGYVKGGEGFSVQIGLVEKAGVKDKGRPTLGVVYQPVIERMYYATPTVGAHLLDADGDRRLTPSKRDFRQLKLVVTESNRSSGIDDMKDALGITKEVKMGSVGVKLGRIADGEYDISFKPANKSTHPWDIAAPDAILTIAGGKFTTVAGKPFAYDRIDIPGGLLATNGASHDDVVRQLRSRGLTRPGLLTRIKSGYKRIVDLVRARR
jgi:3'(2'), 5'-bisphosphate nucleotidase